MSFSVWGALGYALKRSEKVALSCRGRPLHFEFDPKVQPSSTPSSPRNLMSQEMALEQKDDLKSFVEILKTISLVNW